MKSNYLSLNYLSCISVETVTATLERREKLDDLPSLRACVCAYVCEVLAMLQAPGSPSASYLVSRAMAVHLLPICLAHGSFKVNIIA